MKQTTFVLGAGLAVASGIIACTNATPDAPLTVASANADAAVDLGHDGGAADAQQDDAAPPPASIRADRFATKVVSFTPGPCAGFGQESMPGVVLGPPKGAGPTQGSLDVVSLGKAGEIVLSFEPNAVVDGPGVDLVVFENAFFPGGDTTKPFADLGEVSVSDDGVTWTAFECTATAAPYGDCAGWHPVYAAPGNTISPLDTEHAGGDGFDLAKVGLQRARFVRIKDRGRERCTSQSPNTNGFDLDAIVAVNAEDPPAE